MSPQVLIRCPPPNRTDGVSSGKSRGLVGAEKVRISHFDATLHRAAIEAEQP